MSNPKLQLGSDDTYHLQRIIGNDRLDVTVGVTSSKIPLSISDLGYVGIGVTNPGSVFHIDGSVNTSPLSKGIQMGLNGTDVWVELVSQNAFSSSGIDFTYPGQDRRGSIIYTNNNDSFSIYTAAVERIRINSSGNVGIGTNNPNEVLEVNGNIRLSGALHKNANVLTLPDSNDTLVGRATTDTLTNKTIASPSFTGNLSLADATYISTDEIRARDGDGLKLHDDGGNGIFVQDGGTISASNNITVGTTISATEITLTTGANSGYLLTSDGSGNASWTNPDSLTLALIQDNDLDTKIEVEQSSDEDRIRFTTAGTERMIIGSTGFIGIGTDSPNGTLVVDSGSGAFMKGFRNIASSMTAGQQLLQFIGKDESVRNGFWNWYEHVGDGSASNYLKWDVNSLVNILVLRADGNVGIQTDTPGQTLDVNGDTLIRGGDLYLVDTNDKIASDGTDVTIHTGGAQRISIGTTVVIGVDTVIQGGLTVNGDLTYLATETIQVSDTMIALGTSNVVADSLDIGFYGTFNDGSVRHAGLIRDTSDNGIWHLFESNTEPGTTTATIDDRANLHLKVLEVDSAIGYNTNLQILDGGVSGTEVMRIESGGNVGIGTDNPTQKLHVQGDALIQGGDLYLVDTSEYVQSNGTDMIFGVGGSERVRFLSSGNVGIGTDDPADKLSVFGSLGVTSSSSSFQSISNTSIEISTGSPAFIGEVVFKFPEFTTSASKQGIIFADNQGFSRSNVYLCSNLLTDHTTKVSKDDARLTINGSSGNIGIGITQPNATLEVSESVKVGGNIRTGVSEVTANTTLDHSHSIILVGTTGGNVTITLPVSHDGIAEPNFIGSEFKIIKKSAANTVTISRGGSDLIDGSSTSLTLTNDRDRVLIVNTGGANSIGEWHTF